MLRVDRTRDAPAARRDEDAERRDVNELRVVKFKEKIQAAVLSGAGKEFQPLLEQLETENNVPAIEIAAALASMVQGSTPLFLTQKPGVRRAEGAAAHRRQQCPAQTYRIEVGHAHGVLPGNIVGAIANEAGIEGKNIGHIDIREDHSYVDLPGLPEEMLASLQDVRIARRSHSHPARGFETRQAEVQRSVASPRSHGGSGIRGTPGRASGPYAGGKKPYIGGGNRFDKAGEPRPYESRRSESRNYKGFSPQRGSRFKRDDRGPAAVRGPVTARRSKAASRRVSRRLPREAPLRAPSGDKPRFKPGRRQAVVRRQEIR